VARSAESRYGDDKIEMAVFARARRFLPGDRSQAENYARQKRTKALKILIYYQACDLLSEA